MEDSQFCIDDDVEGKSYNMLNNLFSITYRFFDLNFLETPKNSPARVTVSESTTVDLGKFSQSSSSLVNDHLSFHVILYLIPLVIMAVWN